MAGPSTDPSAALRSLLRPGGRLGWVFHDRNAAARPFPQPPPAAPTVPPDVLARAKAANPHLTRNIAIAVPAVLIFSGIAFCALALGAGGRGGLWILATTAVVVLAVSAVAAGLVWLTANQARVVASQPARIEAQNRARHEQVLAQWRAAKTEFETSERAAREQLPEWGDAVVPPATRRLDVVGGSLWGWEGLLTVFGSSLLAERGAVAVLDLTGEGLCGELAELAATAGVPVDLQVLPGEPGALAASDLLTGLSVRDLVDVVVEALHGEGDSGRSDRALDDRVLSAVGSALGEPLSLGRIVAALRALMDEPATPGEPLTEAERAAVVGLFSPAYRRDALPHLRRIEALLHPLAGLGTQPRPGPAARLTCLSTGTAGGARGELLAELAVQRLIRSVIQSGDSGEPEDSPGLLRTVVVVGADPIARRHLERLSDVCERRDVRLVYLFRHLRESSLQLVGGGAVGLMRLGNQQEAERAADFVGRDRRFRLTRLTHQLGGGQTHTSAEAEGRTKTPGTPGGASLRRPLSMLPGLGGSVTRTWQTTASHAEQTRWDEGAVYERVVEHVVEPRTLQGLPDYAMLLVTAGPAGPELTPVETNPAIAGLPRVALPGPPPNPVLPPPG